jgi:hypothetical protein
LFDPEPLFEATGQILQFVICCFLRAGGLLGAAFFIAPLLTSSRFSTPRILLLLPGAPAADQPQTFSLRKCLGIRLKARLYTVILTDSPCQVLDCWPTPSTQANAPSCT